MLTDDITIEEILNHRGPLFVRVGSWSKFFLILRASVPP